MKTKEKSIKSRLTVIGLALVLIPSAWILYVKMEGEKPAVQLNLPATLGASQQLKLGVSDNKTGLRKIKMSFFKEGHEVVLYEKEFPSAGIIDTIKGRSLQKGINALIPFEPGTHKISDGKGKIRLVVTDCSWRDWLKGNRIYIEKEVAIDTRPQEVNILSDAHNVTRGGSGLVIYRISEPCESGVQVGDNFFPGHSGGFKDKTIIMAFFALSHKQGRKTSISIKATDLAGNKRTEGFHHYIRGKKFKRDVLNISDRFLNWKMPEFENEIPSQSQGDNLNKFLAVNREIRKKNTERFAQLGKSTENVLYWKGKFNRLPNSAPKAGFAEHRKYKYNGKVIDEQYHMGADLASVSHAPVPAANKGKVVFSGIIGIFGKTVMIDHGFGLFSTYSHLSAFDVKPGQIVSKGEIIGKTGITGLAGGDHLHFGMMVHDTFVNPVEWWDAGWIKNNITDKIKKIDTGA